MLLDIPEGFGSLVSLFQSRGEKKLIEREKLKHCGLCICAPWNGTGVLLTKITTVTIQWQPNEETLDSENAMGLEFYSFTGCHHFCMTARRYAGVQTEGAYSADTAAPASRFTGRWYIINSCCSYCRTPKGKVRKGAFREYNSAFGRRGKKTKDKKAAMQIYSLQHIQRKLYEKSTDVYICTVPRHVSSTLSDTSSSTETIKGE